MPHRIPVAIAGLAIAIVSSACGAAPGPSGPATSQQAQPATTTKAPVHRPRQLQLSGVDPCSLLSPAQQAQFQTHSPRGGTDEGLNSPMCDLYLRGGSYRLTLVTNDSADSWTNGSRPGQSQPQPAVAGFPTISHADNDMVCDVVVDTADHQYLVATATIVVGYQAKFPEKCAGAHQVAEAAMTTLLANH